MAQKRDHKGRPLSPRSKEELRLKVNQRERQRMHDLNMALDALRQVGTDEHWVSLPLLSRERIDAGSVSRLIFRPEQPDFTLH